MKLPHRTNKLDLQRFPEIPVIKSDAKWRNYSKRPKSIRLSVFRMVTEHVAALFPCLTIELNRISQPISIEIKMVQSLNKAVFATYNFGNLAMLDLPSV